MKKILVANWKMNPNTREEAEALAGVVTACGKDGEMERVILAPPFVYIGAIRKLISSAGSKMALCAQDAFWEEKGAFTGEISPVMLKNEGVSYVLLGHSERRKWLGETDEMVSKKIMAALSQNLNVILCVGEPGALREKGLEAAKLYVKEQLRVALQGINGNARSVVILVAYEPIWAVGTGMPDKPADTAAMAKFIKELCASNAECNISGVLYGGSVTSKNAKAFLEREEIDGALVGGAGLKADEFCKLIEIAAEL